MDSWMSASLRLKRSREVKGPETAMAQWRQGPSLEPEVRVQSLALPVPKPPVPASLSQAAQPLYTSLSHDEVVVRIKLTDIKYLEY